MSTKVNKVKKRVAKSAKTNSKRVHITPRTEGWAVRKEGNQSASKVVKTQKEAVRIGKKWVNEGKSSSVIVHDKRGRFRKA
jgi:RNA:NAD 2'-phosphotransferase (TPT1/KptA family)